MMSSLLYCHSGNVAAFANKAIDAAILTEPLASQAVKDGAAVILVGGDEIVDRMQISVMYFGKRLLDPAIGKVGVRYLMGHLKAMREVYGDGWKNEDIAGIVSEYTHIPVPVIQNSVKPYSEPNGAINEATIENVQKYFIERGYVDYDQVIPLSDMLNPNFLEEALKRMARLTRNKVFNQFDVSHHRLGRYSWTARHLNFLSKYPPSKRYYFKNAVRLLR